MPTLKKIITTTASLFICIFLPMLGVFTAVSVIVFQHAVGGDEVLLAGILSAAGTLFLVVTQLCGMASRGDVHE